MIFIFTGCSKTPESQENILYYNVGMDGEKISVADDQEDVVMIRKNATGYSEASVNADYKNPDMEEENTYYSKEKYELYKNLGRDEVIIGRIQGFRLLEKCESAELTGIEFYKSGGQRSAKVTVDTIATIEHATDEFYEIYELQKDAKCQRTFMLDFIYEDGDWKVSDYDYTDRTSITD